MDAPAGRLRLVGRAARRPPPLAGGTGALLAVERGLALKSMRMSKLSPAVTAPGRLGAATASSCAVCAGVAGPSATVRLKPTTSLVDNVGLPAPALTPLSTGVKFTIAPASKSAGIAVSRNMKR